MKFHRLILLITSLLLSGCQERSQKNKSEQKEKSEQQRLYVEISELREQPNRLEVDNGSPGRPVVVVNLGNTKITDTELAHLKGLTQLRRLFLNNTRISDSGLANLKGLTSLQFLALDNTQITDKGLEYLTELTQLRELHVSDTDITDAAIRYLKSLENLRVLDLGGTQVSDAGIKELQKSLPKAQIDAPKHKPAQGQGDLEGSGQRTAAANKLPVWSSDADAANKLDIETILDMKWGLRFHPPKGFTLKQTTIPQGQSLVYQGPSRPDGTRDTLTLLLGSIDVPTSADKDEVEPYFLGIGRSYTSAMRLSNWSHSETKLGWINGRQFVRVHWNATDSSKRKLVGFVYASIGKGDQVAVMGQVAGSDRESSLKILEAAVLSIRFE